MLNVVLKPTLGLQRRRLIHLYYDSTKKILLSLNFIGIGLYQSLI